MQDMSENNIACDYSNIAHHSSSSPELSSHFHTKRKPRSSAQFVVRRVLQELREQVVHNIIPDHKLWLDIGPRVDTVFYFPSKDYTLSLNYIWPWESMDLCQGKLPYYYKNLEVEEQKLRDEKMMLAYGAHTLRTNVSCDKSAGDGGVGGEENGGGERTSRAYQHLKYLFDTSELREEQLGKAAAAASAASNSTDEIHLSSAATSQQDQHQLQPAYPPEDTTPTATTNVNSRNFLPAMKTAMMVHFPDGFGTTTATQTGLSHNGAAASPAQATPDTSANAFDNAYRLGVSLGLDLPSPDVLHGVSDRQVNADGPMTVSAYPHTSHRALPSLHTYLTHQQQPSLSQSQPMAYYNDAVGLPGEGINLLASVAGTSSPLSMDTPPPLLPSPATLPPPLPSSGKHRAKRKAVTTEPQVADDAEPAPVKGRRRKANLSPGEGSRYLVAGYYCCDQCPYRVRACLRNLRGHLKCHEAGAMYKCSFCTFSSNFPRTINKHEMLHGKLEDEGNTEMLPSTAHLPPPTTASPPPSLITGGSVIPDWARIVTGI